MPVNTQSYYRPGMILSERVEARMKAAGLSQSELARRVGVSQPTIYKLLRRSKKGSTHLHKIARELGTTPAYLAGETDDPDEGAPPPPPPSSQPLMMEVRLPSTAALTSMFQAMLQASRDLDEDELAHELALLLPTGLAAAQGTPASPPVDRRVPKPERLEDGDDGHPESRRASRS